MIYHGGKRYPDYDEVMATVMMLFCLIFMFAAILAHADIVSYRLNTATDHVLPNTFADANARLPISPRNMQAGFAKNNLAVEVAVNCSGVAGQPPPDNPTAGSDHSLYLDPGERGVLDTWKGSGQCYWKSMGAPSSSGVIIFTVTGF